MVFIGIPFIYPFSFFSTYSKPPTKPYSGYSEGIYGFKIVSGRIISASNLQMTSNSSGFWVFKPFLKHATTFEPG
jgi:hypothetical protein